MKKKTNCKKKKLFHRSSFSKLLLFCIAFVSYTGFAQINSGGSHTTADHTKQVIGYVPNWDAWKGPKFDVLAKSLNHYNIDYSQYTILNFSFFGVAVDGSLHSGDLRNKKIYAPDEIQQPADLLHPDENSSHDKAFVLGQPKKFWGWDEKLRALGYEPNPGGAYLGWIRTATGEEGAWPLEEYVEKSMIAIAKENGVKVMASIGGWSMCKHFPEMAADVTKRARFVADCKKLVDEYGFDGIDLDWEYPGPFAGMNFTGTEADYRNFTILVKEIRAAIGPNKLITSAMSAAPNKLGGLEWAELDKYMDYYNMMTYDFNGGWSNKAGHNSPLYDYPEAEYANFSLDATYKRLVELNVNLSKVNLGVAFYGRGVITDGAPSLGAKTKKTSQTFSVDGPVESASDLVRFKDMEGTPYYTTILKELASGNWTEHWDDTAKVPYLTHKTANAFLSYDNEKSLTLKANYISNKKLAGCIVWEVFSDFIVGPESKKIGKYPYCPTTKAPLANVINKAFATTDGGNNNQAPTLTVVAPTAQEDIKQDALQAITLVAEANDVDGSVANVTFEVDNQVLNATLSNNQYTASWTPSAFGNYTVTVTATDNEQATARKSVPFSVSKTTGTPNEAPTLTIVAPTTQEDIKQSTLQAINLVAEANDTDGTVSSVEFTIGNETLQAALSNNQYTVAWTPSSFGAFTVKVVATDNQQATTEKTVSFSVSKRTTNPGGGHPLVSKELWNTLFPYRFGSKDTGGGVWVLDPKDDFYTYEAFIEAINRMGKIKVLFERRCGTNAYKITRTDKTTGVSKVIRTDVDYNAPRNVDKEVVSEEVDYASFLEEGNLETRQREITAFFANISHETTGGWDTAPGGKYSWGLHFREENTNAPYAYPDTNYPPTPGKSYKGRGPIQLSYNYNYGPASEFIFGDKQILLDNPDKVIQDAALAFQTAIWFWMTPQYPKPSAHNVMANKWVPNDLDKTKNRVPGLGMTVNIINGGVECGQGTEKPQVLSRIGYYQRYTGIYNIGTDMDGVHDLSDCGCKDMSKYGGDSADLTAEPCAQKPAITFTSPIDNQVILQDAFSAIAVNIEVDEKNSVLQSLTTTVGSQTFNGKTFSWTPSSYGTHTFTANATFQNGLTASSSIKVIIWDGVNLDCTDIPEWRSTRIYEKPNNYVKYKNVVYRNKWYAAIGATPDTNGVWEKVKDCGTSPGAAPVVTWESPTSGQVIEGNTIPTVSLSATATDSDGTVQSFSFSYNNSTINATKTGDRYTADLTPVAFGQVTVTATATDNSNKTTSKDITFTVQQTGQNTAPVISQVSPADAAVIEQAQLASIELKAIVKDNASVSSVAFVVNNATVAVTANPADSYTATWTPTAFGNVTFEITATDNEGASTTSTTTFTVKKKNNNTGCNGTPAWEPKVYATSGQLVAFNGIVYKNKWYASASEEPGSSDVWAYVRDCNGGSSDEFCGHNRWISSLVYNTGDKVYYQEKIYTAKWWTQNNTPGASNEWAFDSDCPQTNPTNIISRVYPTVVTDQVNFSIESDKNAFVKIVLFDYSGKRVKTLVNENIQSGARTFTKSLGTLKNGLYIYKIYMDGKIQTEKLIKN
nr:chitinase [Aquimarina hainanensis]